MKTNKPSRIIQAYVDEIVHVLQGLKTDRRINSEIGVKPFEGDLVQIRITAPGTQQLESFGNEMELVMKTLEDEGLLENDIMPVIIEWKNVGLFARHINVRPLPAKMGEDINILKALATEIVETFKLAEETHFQEKGKIWPYEVSIQTGITSCSIFVRLGSRGPRVRVEPMSNVINRLYEVAAEVLDNTLFGVRLHKAVSLTTGNVAISMKDS